MKKHCEKIKDGKVTKIKSCSPANIRKLNSKGFTVSKITEEGNKTKIETFSALTKGEAREIARARRLPFN